MCIRFNSTFSHCCIYPISSVCSSNTDSCTNPKAQHKDAQSLDKDISFYTLIKSWLIKCNICKATRLTFRSCMSLCKGMVCIVTVSNLLANTAMLIVAPWGSKRREQEQSLFTVHDCCRFIGLLGY
jgi:hypothetical protein